MSIWNTDTVIGGKSRDLTIDVFPKISCTRVKGLSEQLPTTAGDKQVTIPDNSEAENSLQGS